MEEIRQTALLISAIVSLSTVVVVLWRQNNKLQKVISEKIIEVVVDNTKANEKLANSIDNNTKSTDRLMMTMDKITK